MKFENPKNEYEKKMNICLRRKELLDNRGTINWIEEGTASLYHIYNSLTVEKQEELGDLFLKVLNKI